MRESVAYIHQFTLQNQNLHEGFTGSAFRIPLS